MFQFKVNHQLNSSRLVKSFFLLALLGFLFVSAIKIAFAITLLTDDFTGTTIDTSKWTESDTGSNVSQNGSLTVTGNNAWNSNGLRTVNTYDRGTYDVTIEADVTFSDCSATNGGIIYGPWNAGSLGSGTIIFNRLGGAFKLWSFATSVDVTGVSCTNGVPVHVEMVIYAAGGVDVFLDNNSTPNGSLSSAQAPNTFTGHPVSLQQYASGATITFDNLVISDNSSNITSPGVPRFLLAEGGNSQVILNWTAPSSNGGAAITDYVIEYKQTVGGTWATFNDGTSTNTTATVTGLTNGVNYSFRVSATNSAGTGTATSAVTSVPYVSTTFYSDNFTGSTIDTSKWTEVDSANNVQQNDVLTVVGNDVSWGSNGVTSANTYNRSATDLVIEADVKSTNCSNTVTSNGVSYGDMNPLANPGNSYFVSHYNGFVTLWYFTNGTSTSSVTSFACTNNTNYHVKLVVLQGSGAKLYLNGASTPDATNLSSLPFRTQRF